MAKKRVIISQDYDGCYAIAAPEGVKAELEGRNKRFYQQDKILTAQIKLMPMRYNQFLTEITEDADAVSVYVGSDRQSYALNQLNMKHNQNGSVFSALQDLCRVRTTEDCTWTFEPLLLADGQHERGAAMSRINSKQGPHLEAPDPTMFTKDGKPSKIPMIVKQMWDAYRQYPGEELEFYLIDDRSNLLKDVCERLNPRLIPPGMTVHISRFDYIGVTENEPDAFERDVKTIKSSRAAPVVDPRLVGKPLGAESRATNKVAKVDEVALKFVINNYLLHLEKKLKDNEISFTPGQPLSTEEVTSPIKRKLITRYNVIVNLDKTLGHNTIKEDIESAKLALKECTENKPDWSERPWLQMLTDVLSMGLKPLWRAFNSKETEHEKTLQETIEPTAPGLK